MRWWGRDPQSAMELECVTPPETGVPIIHVGGGRAQPTKMTSSGMADDAVLGRHLSAIDELLFGFPNDGSVVLDGTTDFTAQGLTAIGFNNAYTPSRDINLQSLTVLTGVTILSKGFKIIAQNLTLQGTAVIRNDGAAGGLGGSGSGGAGGTRGQQSDNDAFAGLSAASAREGSIGYRWCRGTDGGNGGAASSQGQIAEDQVAMSPALGGKGGLGSTGDPATAPGISGGGGGRGSTAVTAPYATPYTYPTIFSMFDPRFNCGIAGGNSGTGGGGGGSNAIGNEGGGGAGGAQGGGVLQIFCGTLTLTGWTGRISANGGDGGNGGGKNGTGGLGGIGGEGGGGVVIVVARKIVGGFDVQAINGLTAGYTKQAATIMANAGGKATSGATSSWSPADPGLVIVVDLGNPGRLKSNSGTSLPHFNRLPQWLRNISGVVRNRSPL